jgi:hypothetical protein
MNGHLSVADLLNVRTIDAGAGREGQDLRTSADFSRVCAER